MKEQNFNEEKLKRFEELVDRLEKVNKEEPHHHKNGHPHPHHPMPLEEEKLKIDFKENEELLKEIFGDEDTTKAVMEIMAKSPTEIQIVLKVVIDLHNKIKGN